MKSKWNFSMKVLSLSSNNKRGGESENEEEVEVKEK